MKRLMMLLALTIISAASDIPGEPIYKGHPLSFWVYSLRDSAQEVKAKEAILAVGVPGLQFMLQCTNKMDCVLYATSILAGAHPEVDRMILQAITNESRRVQLNAMESVPAFLANDAEPRLKHAATSLDTEIAETARGNMIRLRLVPRPPTSNHQEMFPDRPTKPKPTKPPPDTTAVPLG